jgi:hypothetical protein
VSSPGPTWRRLMRRIASSTTAIEHGDAEQEPQRVVVDRDEHPEPEGHPDVGGTRHPQHEGSDRVGTLVPRLPRRQSHAEQRAHDHRLAGGDHERHQRHGHQTEAESRQHLHDGGTEHDEGDDAQIGTRQLERDHDKPIDRRPLTDDRSRAHERVDGGSEHLGVAVDVGRWCDGENSAMLWNGVSRMPRFIAKRCMNRVEVGVGAGRGHRDRCAAAGRTSTPRGNAELLHVPRQAERSSSRPRTPSAHAVASGIMCSKSSSRSVTTTSPAPRRGPGRCR